MCLVALTACDDDPESTFTTTVGTDSVDVAPGDGLCADSQGECSLRAAVMEANALPDLSRIVLADDTVYTLTIEGAGEDAALTGDLDITEQVEIFGSGTVDAAGIDRAFDIHTELVFPGRPDIATPSTFYGLTITGGSSDHGAAVRSNGSSFVTLVSTRVTDNVATAGAPIEVAALLTINTTIDGNTGVTAGAIDHGPTHQLTILSSTISGNIGTAGAGAIRTTSPSGVVGAVTITDNDGTTVGGVDTLSGTTVAVASIIADQTAGDEDCLGALVSSGSNVESGASCGFGAPSDQQHASVLLKPLADNGGDQPTHLPSLGSAAVDAWTECGLDTDQRLSARPHGPACDSGAVEATPAELTGHDCGPPHNLVPGAQLQYCDLSDEDLVGVDLTGADLTGADLSGANALFATFDGADLSGTSFAGATVIGVDFETSILTPTTTFAGANALGAGFAGTDLTGIDFAGASLTNADLSTATLTGSDLTGATLKGANLAFASDLPGTVGVASTLPGSWRGTNFAAAHLDVTGVALGSADFTNANFFGATGFGTTDPSLVTWNNTICPDGTNSNANGSTCVGHFTPPGAPLVTIDAGTPDGNDGWFVTSPVPGAVTVTIDSYLVPLVGPPACTDNGDPVSLSGSSPGPWTFDVGGDGIHALECTATDLAANSGSDDAIVKIDTQGFDYTLTTSPEPNANGWHPAGPVTLTVTLNSPSVSGLDIDASDCTESIDGGPAESIDFDRFTIDTETGNASVDIDGNGIHVIECDVYTNAGILTTGGATVRIDDQVPTGTTEVIPAPNANGWHNTEPTLRATMTADNISGIDFANSGCTRNGIPVPLTEYDFTPPDILDIVVHDDGIFDYECTVTNLAGVSQSSSATIKVDKQPVGLALSAPPADYVDEDVAHPGDWYTGPVTVDLAITGTNLSGIDPAALATFCTDGGNPLAATFPAAGPDDVELTIEGDGTHEILCQVTTVAGLVSTDTLTVNIDSELGAPGLTGIITTIAGTGVNGYNGDGIAGGTAQVDAPFGIAVDSVGNVYFADYGNARVRKVDTNGIITTVAGTGTPGYNGDNIDATTAQLSGPYNVAVDASGNLYIADAGNARVRRVDTNGIITTVAGTGTPGYNGDDIDATTAQISSPYGIEIHPNGNLYIADTGNGRVRRIDSGGTITTVAGTGTFGYNGDNIDATTAHFRYPWDVDIDTSGNLFIADYYNNRIRKVDTTGTITTVAGDGTYGYNGDNIPATTAHFRSPSGVVVDHAGNLYIADSNNYRVHRVDTGGTLTTAAGTDSWGYNGDNIPATTARLHGPQDVAVDSAGRLYISDSAASRVRKVS